MHSNQGEPNETLNQIPTSIGTCNHSPIPPQSDMERDFKNLKENIRNMELEQIKTRNAIQSIEILIHQKHSSGVPLLQLQWVYSTTSTSRHQRRGKVTVHQCSVTCSDIFDQDIFPKSISTVPYKLVSHYTIK